jgi:3-phosphoshikimate 1-carboxyvinyltransferase
MYSVSKKSFLNGKITVPGSKSHTIRAALLSAMAKGVSVIHNPLASGDGLSALQAARAFGAKVDTQNGAWVIEGTGGNLALPENVLDCGNSGTTTNFAMSLAALCNGYTVITGDEQIRRRPVAALAATLNALGAEAFFTRPDSDSPPVVIKGKRGGGEARFSGFNSQVVSSTLLASPLVDGRTVVLVEKPLEKPYLQMTVDWMKRYGVELTARTDDYTRFVVAGGGAYTACESVIPADWSAAAFPLVAAVCAPSEVTLCGLDFGDSQGDKIVVDHLIAMGADIVKDEAGGRLFVRGGKPLDGGAVINLNDIPDSLPALAVAACFTRGNTTFTGLAHVRVKETDRVDVMQAELAKLGAAVRTTVDSMTVRGSFDGGADSLHGAEVDSRGDHRIAMALAIAGLFCGGETRVLGAECAAVSFPVFFELLSGAGASIKLYE